MQPKDPQSVRHAAGALHSRLRAVDQRWSDAIGLGRLAEGGHARRWACSGTSSRVR
jgi:hypothetical protein